MPSGDAAPPLETLASFLPARVVAHLAHDPSAPIEPQIEQVTTAVLFADISGFTPMAARLAKRGAGGAEELTSILNAYFERLIAIIHAHGGDVTKFAGDGLLALWTANDPAELPLAVQCAARCGLAVQAALHNYLAANEVRLTLHAGVGAGDVRIYSIGGMFRRWEIVVAGVPLIEMSHAARSARPGEVVIADEAWHFLRGMADGQKRETGGIRLERIADGGSFAATKRLSLPPAVERAVRAFIPNAVLTRLDAGQDAWLAELRRLTVIFVNLPDFTAQFSLKRAQTLMNAMQSALYRYEGSLNQLSVDDKGITLVAAMGLPPLAHEDDAFRGVQAAQAIQANLRELGIRSAIGLTTGRVFCGVVGSSLHRQYALVGDVMNLAARIMQAAPADILCDKATQRAAASRMRFEELPPQAIKGEAGPVQLFRPYCKMFGIDVTTSMIGREAELALLAAGLEAVLDRKSAVFFIAAEAGMGKSRLLAELTLTAEKRGVRVLSARGDSVESAGVLHAWRPLFQSLFDLEGLDRVEDRKARAIAQLAGDPILVRLAPLLNTVLPVEFSENETTAQMTGKVRADNTNDILCGVLARACEQRPTLLVVEDAHWLDSASWALLRAASQRLDPVLLVIASRPLVEPMLEEARLLLEDPNLTRMDLQPLPTEDATQLVCQRLGVASLPQDVSALVRDRAQGNPFFSEELGYALRDTGLLVFAHGECTVASGVDLRSVNFPDSVQGVVTGRIDRLAPTQQLTLKVASVIGRIFALRLLRGVYPVEAERGQLNDNLQMLDRLDLTMRELSSPDLAYIFKHVITQEVAYNLMLFAQRRQLHRAVAEWFETTGDCDHQSLYPLLAHHWSHTDESAKAAEYLEKAGEQALRSGAYVEAVTFFSKALERMPEPPVSDALQNVRRARILRQLAASHFGLGALERSCEYYERCLKELGYPRPKTKTGLAAAILCEIATQAFRRIAAPFRQPAADAREIERRLEGARAEEQLAVIYYFTENVPFTLHATLRCLNFAEGVGCCPELARGYGLMAATVGFIPLHSLAQVYERLARKTDADVGQPAASAWISLALGLYCSGAGRLADAEVALVSARKIYTDLGDRRRLIEATSVLSDVLHRQGRFVERIQHGEEAYRIACDTRDLQGQIFGLTNQAESYLCMGAFEQSETLMIRTLGLLTGHVNPTEKWWAHALMSLTQLRLGRPENAQKAAEEAAQFLTGSASWVSYVMDGYMSIAEVWLELWAVAGPSTPEASERRKKARWACRELRKYSRMFSAGLPRALYLHGRWKWQSGKARAAYRAWKKSLLKARSIGMPYDEALAHLELGLHGARDSVAIEHLRGAREIFTRLGAASDLARVECALASVTA